MKIPGKLLGLGNELFEYEYYCFDHIWNNLAISKSLFSISFHQTPVVIGEQFITFSFQIKSVLGNVFLFYTGLNSHYFIYQKF